MEKNYTPIKKEKQLRIVKLEKEKVETIIQNCKEASIIISLLTRCIIGIRKIEDCFSVENKNLVINYQALKPVKRYMTVGKAEIDYK